MMIMTGIGIAVVVVAAVAVGGKVVRAVVQVLLLVVGVEGDTILGSNHTSNRERRNESNKWSKEGHEWRKEK